MKTAGFIIAIVVLMLITLGIGLLIGVNIHRQPTLAQQPALAEEQKIEFWTCSMHPQIRQPKPGKCPICFMDLIPVKTGGRKDLGPREVHLSANARKLAQIETAPVERKFVSVDVRMAGKVDYDETRLARITAWVPGRLDRLFVDYTGIPVRKGDHLVDLYSPELLSAQEELLQAIKAVEDIKDSPSDYVRRATQQTLEATREKLRLWGLTAEQIKRIEETGQPSDHITIYSPIGGIVIHKNAVEGMYVDVGTRIYTIADLSQVWVKLDAYESDLAWIRYGQSVELETEAYPGETFSGTIAFIDPVLNAQTRTVKVRVNVPNAGGRLKPEMFLRAVVHSTVAAGGRVMDADLSGKWLCPMHPEIVKEGPGPCDICEMPLVRAESMGYAAATAEQTSAPLVIPASAPLITGKRAVVYVADPDNEGVYGGREIVLGQRAGDFYLVREGLEEGEMVVVNGNFKIDSALQIQAKPSMMSPEGGAPPPGHQHGGPSGLAAPEPFEVPDAFKAQLDAVLSAYFDIHRALSNDDLDLARDAAATFSQALAGVDMMLLKEPAHSAWMKEMKELQTSATSLTNAEDIEKARTAFALLSETTAAAAGTFGTSGAQPVLRFHCPMAFGNRGADWLQNDPDTANPYFGAAMLRCGEQTEVIAPGPEAPAGDNENE